MNDIAKENNVSGAAYVDIKNTKVSKLKFLHALMPRKVCLLFDFHMIIQLLYSLTCNSDIDPEYRRGQRCAMFILRQDIKVVHRARCESFYGRVSARHVHYLQH